ncbi:MAG: hypothetical protein U9Q07_06205 [Planctomycetota bacterium]|nr:hypothetical protein [Planctomycetota bacterium]
MTIELHDAVNGDGLMDVQGKAFDAMETLFTAIGTTVPTDVTTFLTQFQTRSDADDLDVAESMEGLGAAVASWQNGASTLSGKIRSNLIAFLQEVVANDASQPEDSLTFALQYIIDQMIADGDYVEANTIGFTLTAGVSNSGDPAVCYTSLRGDGQVNQNILAETIAITVSEQAGPTLRFRSPLSQSNRLSHDWPKGSGVDTTIYATDPADSLLSNGDFEDETIANVPDDWMVHVGTPGTTVKLTDIEVQTVVISGSPEGGSYLLQWTGPDSITRSTGPLAYNASGSTIQTALQAIPGLGSATVASTGTSPNYTHTITLTDTVGDPGQLTSVNDLTGGSSPTITHATTTASSAGAYRGKALEFDSDGAEVTALYHALTLSPDTVYFCHARVKRIGAVSAGEVRIEIVDGIGGTVVQDGESNAALHTITATSISATDHDSEWFSFRVPPGTNMPVYLRIRISTAITDTCSVFFDDVAVVEGTRFYAGGPYVAVLAGVTNPGPDDTWSLVVANDRAGDIQEWYNRVFDMDGKGLLLPVFGTSLIPESWT